MFSVIVISKLEASKGRKYSRPMKYVESDTEETILHTLDLGQHVLWLMHDGGSRVIASTEQTDNPIETAIQLTRVAFVPI